MPRVLRFCCEQFSNVLGLRSQAHTLVVSRFAPPPLPFIPGLPFPFGLAHYVYIAFVVWTVARLPPSSCNRRTAVYWTVGLHTRGLRFPRHPALPVPDLRSGFVCVTGLVYCNGFPLRATDLRAGRPTPPALRTFAACVTGFVNLWVCGSLLPHCVCRLPVVGHRLLPIARDIWFFVRVLGTTPDALHGCPNALTFYLWFAGLRFTRFCYAPAQFTTVTAFRWFGCPVHGFAFLVLVYPHLPFRLPPHTHLATIGFLPHTWF